LNHDLNFR